MSLGEFDAEKKFWATPELVEKLHPLLDLASTKELAEAHQLTRQILGGVLAWNKLIKKTFPEDENINVDQEDLPKEDDLHLASERPKAKLLSEIMNMFKGSQRALLEMDLLHTICERYKRVPDSERYKREPGSVWTGTGLNFVRVTCFCNQIHDVSPRGFVILEDVEATSGSRKQSVVEVFIDSISGDLMEPLLTVLSSRMINQLEMVRSLNIWAVGCNTEASAEAFARVVKNSQGEGLEAWWHPLIFVYGEIGPEGWMAILRATEYLPDSAWDVTIRCERNVLAAGRRDDLRAIWGKIHCWWLDSGEDGPLCFEKDPLGEKGGWEGFEGKGWPSFSRRGGSRKGLNAVIDMSEEEWMEEFRHVEELEERELSSDNVEEDEEVEEGDFGPE